ncbi:hypothetical protein [Ensifer canadensis]|uniref:hypothetical protein n=1 Tax=Ensifer canadensis TaxID=555315 RepID=UPI001CED31B1|nr:hypothetical protein [Ensifer canadensis]
MLIAQSSDTSGPFTFDRGPPFELEAEFAKEINRPSQIFDDDSYVVHPPERHVSNLQCVAPDYKVSPVQQRTLELPRFRRPSGLFSLLPRSEARITGRPPNCFLEAISNPPRADVRRPSHPVFAAVLISHERAFAGSS